MQAARCQDSPSSADRTQLGPPMRRRLAAGDPTATAAAAAAVAPLPLEHPPPDQAWPPQPYASPPRRPWRKVLYERQPHGDAYTAESFLEELVVNATVRRQGPVLRWLLQQCWRPAAVQQL